MYIHIFIHIHICIYLYTRVYFNRPCKTHRCFRFYGNTAIRNSPKLLVLIQKRAWFSWSCTKETWLFIEPTRGCHIYIYIYTYIHKHTYIYIYTCIHIYIYTYIRYHFVWKNRLQPFNFSRNRAFSSAALLDLTTLQQYWADVKNTAQFLGPKRTKTILRKIIECLRYV